MSHTHQVYFLFFIASEHFFSLVFPFCSVQFWIRCCFFFCRCFFFFFDSNVFFFWILFAVVGGAAFAVRMYIFYYVYAIALYSAFAFCVLQRVKNFCIAKAESTTERRTIRSFRML